MRAQSASLTVRGHGGGPLAVDALQRRHVVGERLVRGVEGGGGGREALLRGRQLHARLLQLRRRIRERLQLRAGLCQLLPGGLQRGCRVDQLRLELLNNGLGLGELGGQGHRAGLAGCQRLGACLQAGRRAG